MYVNFSITVGMSAAEEISEYLLDCGALSVSQAPFEGGLKLTALFDESVSDNLAEEFAEFDPVIETVEDRDWQNEWIEHYEPVVVDDVCAIIPAGMVFETEVTRIEIDPRDAFGSGTHPTTIMCLHHLNDVIMKSEVKPEDLRLIDIGTGSGILAIFAALKGVGIAEGFDIEEKAVIRAGENAARNGISSRTRFHVSSIENLSGYGLYDIVCANLQSVIIENNIEKIIRCVKPGGVIIASGIGAQWKKGIRRLFVENGLDIDTEAESEGWMGYILSPRREKLLD